MNSSTRRRHLLYIALGVLGGVTFAWAQTPQQQAGEYNAPEVKGGAQPQESRAKSPACAADGDEAPVRSVPDLGVITTRQSITPAGIQAIFESGIYGVTFGATSAVVYALTAPRSSLVIFKMDWRTNQGS